MQVPPLIWEMRCSGLNLAKPGETAERVVDMTNQLKLSEDSQCFQPLLPAFGYPVLRNKVHSSGLQVLDSERPARSVFLNTNTGGFLPYTPPRPLERLRAPHSPFSCT